MQIDLSVKNITKTFKDFFAVNSVSFAVEDGQFFSILGPSGCGKTSTLRMIVGLCHQPLVDFCRRSDINFGILKMQLHLIAPFNHKVFFRCIIDHPI